MSSATGSAKILASHPLGSISTQAGVPLGGPGTRSSAVSALLQQRGFRAKGIWTLPAEPHSLEAAPGEGTHQVPFMGYLLTEPDEHQALGLSQLALA